MSTTEYLLNPATWSLPSKLHNSYQASRHSTAAVVRRGRQSRSPVAVASGGRQHRGISTISLSAHPRGVTLEQPRIQLITGAGRRAAPGALAGLIYRGSRRSPHPIFSTRTITFYSKETYLLYLQL